MKVRRCPMCQKRVGHPYEKETHDVVLMIAHPSFSSERTLRGVCCECADILHEAFVANPVPQGCNGRLPQPERDEDDFDD